MTHYEHWEMILEEPKMSPKSTKAFSQLDIEKNLLESEDEEAIPVLKQCKSMSSIAFTAYCEKSLKKVSSFEKLIENEKMRLRLIRFERNKMEVSEKLMAKDMNKFPKANNLRQLKRKCNIFRYRETFKKLSEIQNEQ